MSIPLPYSSIAALLVVCRAVLRCRVPAWFGQIASNLSESDLDTYDLVNSQVFAADEWLPTITAMQAAQATNNGIVVSLTHTTAENARFGIEAGRTVKVLWVYNGRVINWENQLDAEMRLYLTPVEDPENQAKTVKTGPFKDFPWYTTKLDSIFFAQSNLLADLGGWLVYQHKELFMEALGLVEPVTVEPTSAPSESGSTSSGGGSDGDFADSTAGISVITVCVLVGVAVGGYFLYRDMNSKSSWGADLKESWLGGGGRESPGVVKEWPKPAPRNSTTELISAEKNPMGPELA
jgi:hypothetical protein